MAFWNKKSSEFSVSESVRATPAPAAAPTSTEARSHAAPAAQAAAAAAPVKAAVETPLPQTIPAVRTVITKGTKIEGRLSFDAPIRIEGCVRGELLSSKQVVFGKNSRIDASVRAASIVVEGFVSGEIHARETLLLKKGSQISGKIVTPQLVVEEGAVINARVWISEESVASKKQPLSASIERSVDQGRTARAAVPSAKGGHERIDTPATVH